jgi:hypothetical protein
VCVIMSGVEGWLFCIEPAICHSGVVPEADPPFGVRGTTEESLVWKPINFSICFSVCEEKILRFVQNDNGFVALFAIVFF